MPQLGQFALSSFARRHHILQLSLRLLKGVSDIVQVLAALDKLMCICPRPVELRVFRLKLTGDLANASLGLGQLVLHVSNLLLLLG